MRSVDRDPRQLKRIASRTRRMSTFAAASTSACHGSSNDFQTSTSPAYYRAILADSGTDAANAVVIDDAKTAIGRAGECGLRGVLVRRQAGEPFDDSVLRAFDEVNALL
jgi:hypothetical protein